MDKISFNKRIFNLHEYSLEEEFEKDVLENAVNIFGPRSLYIDIKKRIRNDNIVTIPDGYLINFSFETEPQLFIVENELVTHDPYRHIGQQLLKFATAYKASGREIKEFLLDHILNSNKIKSFIGKQLRRLEFRNVDAFLEHLIFETEIRAIIVIDEITPDLENVLSQLSMKTDIIEFQTFVRGKARLHKYTPLFGDIEAATSIPRSPLRPEELDTIIVPANEEGFRRVFLGEDSWYAIRISSSMIERVKYIAAYQTAPVSAVTYWAEVKKIERYKNSSKYIVHFKQKAKKIGPIKLLRGKGVAPQGPRYSTYKKLKGAKSLYELF